jgi:hypothetical protein
MACGREHLAVTLRLPTMGYREHRSFGYIEATAPADSVAYPRKYAAVRGGFWGFLPLWPLTHHPPQPHTPGILPPAVASSLALLPVLASHTTVLAILLLARMG